MTILIAGAGIAGLTLGLTLHQIGVPFRIYERTAELTPLGVGINLQPNAVRELFDLGLEAMLNEIGVRTREYGFYSNVNPEVNHPRWSQARERVIGGGLFAEKRPTLKFNGYENEVASLYDGMDLEKLY